MPKFNGLHCTDVGLWPFTIERFGVFSRRTRTLVFSFILQTNETRERTEKYRNDGQKSYGATATTRNNNSSAIS